MYEIRENGILLSTEDVLRYTKRQVNGIDCLCPKDEADGIVVGGSIVPIDAVTVSEFNGAAKIERVTAEGAALAQASTEEPPATVGVLAAGFEKWEPDRDYKQYELFDHEGKVGFARQAITSSAVYPPFSPGTEALYGVRPIPDDMGIYPYEYNMAASKGMRVRDADGVVWYCYNPIDPLVYTPGQVPAHFERENQE